MAQATGLFPIPREGRLSAFRRSIACVLLLLLLAGCRIEPITPTTAAQPSITPSVQLPLASLLPTLDKTATAQPQAAPSPTSENRLPPEVDSIIFRDPLDSNRFNWPLTGGSLGSSNFTDGMLAFTVRTPNTSIRSILPRDFPPDLYVEVTMTTMFCSTDLDSFGFIFRATAERNYRLAITCSGKIRLERDLGMAMDGAKTWQDSPGLLSGAPAENRIGLLIRGSEFRVYIAGLEAYATGEPLVPSGGLGLFARTGKSDLLTVAFKDLVVYSIVQQ
jgi:hypothetical protein